MAQKERRKDKEPIRQNLNELLNQHQRRALGDMESSGWKLFCVRTSFFKKPVVVVSNSDGDVFAAMEHDGELNFTPGLAFRKDDLIAVWPRS